jgi:hypothetical protein
MSIYFGDDTQILTFAFSSLSGNRLLPRGHETDVTLFREENIKGWMEDVFNSGKMASKAHGMIDSDDP